MTTSFALRTQSPVGPLTLVSDGRALTHASFDIETNHGLAAAALEAGPGPDAIVRLAQKQLDEFFSGARRAFDLPLGPLGTPFQHAVWAALRAIPFGETRSYRDIARAIGSPKAVRAVGAANGKNPLAIIVPCHRVIAADGSLSGYAGGVSRKRDLLAFERASLDSGRRGALASDPH